MKKFNLNRKIFHVEALGVARLNKENNFKYNLKLK